MTPEIEKLLAEKSKHGVYLLFFRNPTIGEYDDKCYVGYKGDFVKSFSFNTSPSRKRSGIAEVIPNK